MDWTKFHPAPVIGVDEVGRGCLAGPVVAAAVVLSRPQTDVFFDSKLVPEKRRVELFKLIQSEHRYAIGFATVAEINRLNILHASLLAMRRAVEGLKIVGGGHLLVDGKFKVRDLKGFQQTTLIQGDSRAECISAASIAAKVTRDEYMKELAEKFPEYGFEIHKGYGTLQHRDALAGLGPTRVHRRHFRGVFSGAEG